MDVKRVPTKVHIETPFLPRTHKTRDLSLDVLTTKEIEIINLSKIVEVFAVIAFIFGLISLGLSSQSSVLKKKETLTHEEKKN